MKNILLVTLALATILFSDTVLTKMINAVDRIREDNFKVIYGGDDRRSVHHSKLDAFKVLADSTAVMMESSSIAKIDIPSLVLLVGNSLSKEMGICSDSRFASEPAFGLCSGFLIAPDLLVTAGHCIASMSACQSNMWVFDYRIDMIGNNGSSYILRENIYSCVEIVAHKIDIGKGIDYSVIRLDRPTNRPALKFRREGQIAKGENLVVIGHPSGVPTKIAGNAQVRTDDNPYFFKANLDTFGGNSGSAVFNLESQEVEGVLVRGERDYIYDRSKKCYVVNNCLDDGCDGEDVVRITQLDLPVVLGEVPAREETETGTVDGEISMAEIVELLEVP
ncbi:MAG: trypsin-like peptidase domain-containing protein [Bdellovibrionales bacterium]|nr:trypsin-like peptidase domain-containing protein [Bdellovibrionales bacterium]MBT3525045.1 trypsin-like peptidase domain-containing protein [Bdellovibrionales bacterium]MBT7669388.1 trypsin-like peptidase domain-containing protein [Bdellovibrionales bacterium]MBT7767729.1 trypsin-like peptidase domain-containing protein [Bdellovibrionales bacterium]